MNLNGINLVEYNGYYMLVNYSLRKPVMVSKRVYDTLSEVKKGTPIQELKEKYGEDLLEIIEKKMRELDVKPQIISGDFRRLYKVEIPVTVCG